MNINSENPQYVNISNEDNFKVVHEDIDKMGGILESLNTAFKFYAERKHNHKKGNILIC